jgi:predicted PurR-regulated permease PerM
MPDKAIDHWLQTTVVYGLAFTFLALFCLIMLWVFWRVAVHGVGVVAVLREWLPKWFQAQTESHQQIKTSVASIEAGHKEQMNLNREQLVINERVATVLESFKVQDNKP